MTRWWHTALLCAGLALSGCHSNARPETPGVDDHRLPPVAVADAAFAVSVHKLMREGKPSAERSALLAGVIRRQLTHASEHFARGDAVRGSDAVIGALYLLRLGEARLDMFDKASLRALSGTIERFSARGDEGRALALMHMKQKLLPKNSREQKELAAHMAALQRWRKDTRTGGDMAKLSADERAEVGRALLEPSKESLQKAHKAVERWIARAVEYNVRYQQTRQLPPREEVVEAYRALQTGGQTMAALYLRHGRAREAVSAIESSAASRITDPAFFHRLRSAAVDDTAEDWRN
ncbi:MAG TPA: hypothetical protein VFB62_12740, partial [Polyangiaceae bacterium]|nr:hypothetical protein [Polyangiaceae bacterium]